MAEGLAEAGAAVIANGRNADTLEAVVRNLRGRGLKADISPAGTKTGDLLHSFNSGAFENFTDVTIDAAGNVWCANNWYDIPVATGLAKKTLHVPPGAEGPESMSSME